MSQPDDLSDQGDDDMQIVGGRQAAPRPPSAPRGHPASVFAGFFKELGRMRCDSTIFASSEAHSGRAPRPSPQLHGDEWDLEGGADLLEPNYCEDLSIPARAVQPPASDCDPADIAWQHLAQMEEDSARLAQQRLAAMPPKMQPHLMIAAQLQQQQQQQQQQ